MPSAVNNSSNGRKSSVTKNTSRVYSYVQHYLDWVIPPSSRQHAYDVISNFAAARPILFSFLVVQALLSFFPILLFATFSVCVIVIALGAAIAFALLWIGIALLVLVPTLLVTSSIAVLVWAWCVGSFLVARWLYAHAPFGVQGQVHVDAAGKQVSIVKNEQGLDGAVKNVE